MYIIDRCGCLAAGVVLTSAKLMLISFFFQLRVTKRTMHYYFGGVEGTSFR